MVVASTSSGGSANDRVNDAQRPGGPMSSEPLERARQGFSEWQEGDFDRIEAMLDPNEKRGA